jgi:hypothetical protein
LAGLVYEGHCATVGQDVHTQFSAVATLACAGFSQRVGLTLASVAILSAGGLLLYFSRAGKIKSLNCAGVYVKGEGAKLCSTIFAIIILLIGALSLVSMLFRLDC